MKKCSWNYCNKSAFQVNTKNIPLINVYSCEIHTNWYCSLCDLNIVNYLTNTNDGLDNFQNNITWHVTSHAFKGADGNRVGFSPDGRMMLINNKYFDHMQNKRKLCYISDITKTYPHFIYLMPEFLFSDILDNFDETEVPDWYLLFIISSKSFSCLICGGRFESFPSNEVFNAHPCQS